MISPKHLRVRVSWVGFGPTNSAISPETKLATEHPGGNTTPSALLQVIDPQRLRVRVKWIGFGSTDSGLQASSTLVRKGESNINPLSGRLLGSFSLPKVGLRVIWMGLGSTNRRSLGRLGLLAVLLIALFAFTRLSQRSDANYSSDTENVVPAGLVADDIPLGNETIRMIHSPLDIGQAKDVFDNNIDTLMRGRDANPFIIDLRFSQPQAIKGLVMYFGRMDFVMRVQVYGIEGSKPISYQGEYRQQPDIPRIDMDFADGPDQVSRIYIEIEQLNPPDQVHIHVREIVFKR